jgi:hypothetical protein
MKLPCPRASLCEDGPLTMGMLGGGLPRAPSARANNAEVVKLQSEVQQLKNERYCVCMYVCVHVCICACMHSRMFVMQIRHVCFHASLRVCMHDILLSDTQKINSATLTPFCLYIYIHMDMYIHIYIHTLTHMYAGTTSRNSPSSRSR